jgi:hypothetical protein
MNLRYRKVGHQGEYVNKQINIDLRQKFALDILRLLKFGKTIINFDESIISGTCSKSYSWERKGRTQSRVLKRSTSGISILLAVSSDGIRFFQFMDGINNQDSIQAFFLGLVTNLDRVRPQWRETHFILLDNMSSHKTSQTLALFEKLRMPYMFSAPASYKSIPVESVFMHLKLTDFRIRTLPTNVLIKGMRHDQLTKKQNLLAQMSDYLLNISDERMKQIFHDRLRNLGSFLALERV